MTTFKEKLEALHDALSDAYDEDRRTMNNMLRTT